MATILVVAEQAGGHLKKASLSALTAAQQLGYQPEVILAGRRINNNMGPYVAQKLVKLLIDAGAKTSDRSIFGWTPVLFAACQ